MQVPFQYYSAFCRFSVDFAPANDLLALELFAPWLLTFLNFILSVLLSVFVWSFYVILSNLPHFCQLQNKLASYTFLVFLRSALRYPRRKRKVAPKLKAFSFQVPSSSTNKHNSNSSTLQQQLIMFLSSSASRLIRPRAKNRCSQLTHWVPYVHFLCGCLQVWLMAGNSGAMANQPGVPPLTRDHVGLFHEKFTKADSSRFRGLVDKAEKEIYGRPLSKKALAALENSFKKVNYRIQLEQLWLLMSCFWRRCSHRTTSRQN